MIRQTKQALYSISGESFAHFEINIPKLASLLKIIPLMSICVYYFFSL